MPSGMLFFLPGKKNSFFPPNRGTIAAYAPRVFLTTVRGIRPTALQLGG